MDDLLFKLMFLNYCERFVYYSALFDHWVDIHCEDDLI